jgi:hypothetical protein
LQERPRPRIVDTEVVRVAHLSVASYLSLIVWTLWLGVAMHQLAVRLVRPISLRRSVTIELERPVPIRRTVSPGGVAAVPLSIIFVALGLILVPTSIISWRAYVMAALAVAALAAAFALPPGADSDKFTHNQRLVVSSASLAGVLWLWLQGQHQGL